MHAADVAWLQTAEGEAAARLAAERLATTGDELRTIEALRRSYPPGRARAALALAIGRRSLEGKLTDAGTLYCDREAAEQASNELVARHTARRFAGRRLVADLGCGMGGDTLAIAEHSPVLAVDRDPARVAMTEANAAARGLGDRVACTEADLETVDRSACDALWLDPARRDQRGRIQDPARWAPPLSVALDLAGRTTGAGIKLAPGVDRDQLPVEGEREFISLDGNLVAAVLWLGDLAAASRRATALTSDGSTVTIAGEPDPPDGRVAAVGAYLYDPDPAVGRAQLIHELAASFDAWQLDARVAYLSSARPVRTPLARRFRVLASLPFSERRLLEELRRHEAGRVEVMRRGAPIDPNELASRLDRRLDGRRVLTVALTRVGAEPAAIVCERERD